MYKKIKRITFMLLIFSLLFLSIGLAFAEKKTENKEHKSYPWFKQSFLDLSEDIEDAREHNKGLILYFHQEGCPYCKKLLNDNFSRPNLVKRLTNQYDFIAMNMWGDRDVIDIDGKQLTEKSLAVKLKVMFTPTLIFINQQGKIEFRLNGYYSPAKFTMLLDYLRFTHTKNDKKRVQSFNQYYRRHSKGGTIAKNSVIKNAIKGVSGKNYALLSKQSELPTMIMFAEKECNDCDELRKMIQTRPEINALFRRYSLFKVNIHSNKSITDINGKTSSGAKWSDDLNIQYTPTLVFFDKDKKTGKIKEIFRADSYLKAFHLESVLLYVADKHYIQFPEFQRYIHERVDKLEEKGVKIELWK